MWTVSPDKEKEYAEPERVEREEENKEKDKERKRWDWRKKEVKDGWGDESNGRYEENGLRVRSSIIESSETVDCTLFSLKQIEGELRMRWFCGKSKWQIIGILTHFKLWSFLGSTSSLYHVVYAQKWIILRTFYLLTHDLSPAWSSYVLHIFWNYYSVQEMYKHI